VHQFVAFALYVTSGHMPAADVESLVLFLLIHLPYDDLYVT